MKNHILPKLFSVLGILFWGSPAFSQTLHLTQTLNYGKHISDIDFATNAPYNPRIFVYKIHPKEQIAEEISMVSDGPADTTKYVPPPPPPPVVEYGLQIPAIKTSWDLKADEFCQFLSSTKLITESKGDTVFRLYSISPHGLICIDSLIFPLHTGYSGISCHSSDKGIFHLTQTIKTEDGLTINFYDSAFKKVATFKEPRTEYEVNFMDDDNAFILNWTKQSTNITIQKFSLSKGRLFETIIELPAEMSSWGQGVIQANDTMVLVYAQMYHSRKTCIYAINLSGKIYWKTDIPDMTEEIVPLSGAKKMACSFYNVQGISTIKFYSLLTGKFERTINMETEIPEFAATTGWPVYLPLRTTYLPGGKWLASIIDCYAPNNQSKTAYYLLISNGTKTFKTKLRKTKSITSTNITPFSSSRFSVGIDDDIYYYSIY